MTPGCAQTRAPAVLDPEPAPVESQVHQDRLGPPTVPTATCPRRGT